MAGVGWETWRRLSDETFLDSSQVRGSAALGAHILEVEAEEKYQGFSSIDFHVETYSQDGITTCSCSVTKSTLCNCMNCSLLGSTVHGISQARILEWINVSFSRGSSWPRDQTCVSCIGRWIFFFFFLPLNHLGSPYDRIYLTRKGEKIWKSSNRMKKCSIIFSCKIISHGIDIDGNVSEFFQLMMKYTK